MKRINCFTAKAIVCILLSASIVWIKCWSMANW